MLHFMASERMMRIRLFFLAGLVMLTILFLAGRPVSAADFPLEFTMDANGGVFTKLNEEFEPVPTNVSVTTLKVSKAKSGYTFNWGDYHEPVLEGKGFLGWSTSKDGSTDLYYHYTGTNSGSITFPLDGSVTKMYAVWGNTVELTLHANGGTFSGGKDTSVVKMTWYNKTSKNRYVYSDGESTPTKKGAYLLGWSADPKATVPDYYGNISNRLDELKSNELYATWTDVVAVTLDANGNGRFGTETKGGVTKDITSRTINLIWHPQAEKTIWTNDWKYMENVGESKRLLGWYVSGDYSTLYATDLSDLPINDDTPHYLLAAWGDRDVSELYVSNIPSQEATDEPFEPDVEVYHPLFKVKLEKGKDFTVTYADNTAPGTAKAIITGIGEYTGKKEVEFFISKPDKDPTKEAAVIVTAPKAIEGLTCTGQAQALVTAGEVAGGKMVYALGDEKGATADFDTAIPTATEAGTWFVWYKAVGDDDHLNTEMAFVKVTIAEAAKPEEEKEKETGEQPAPPETANGLINDPQLGWVLMKNGAVDTGYTGLYSDPAIGWWFIRNGAIDWDYVGLFNDPNVGWWLISGGTIAWDYTGLWDDANYGWWLIAGGRLCAEYTGLWNDPNYGWWLIGGGRLCSEYTGLWNDPNYGWWLIAEGRLCAEYTGLWEDPSLGWWLIQNGTIAFDYTGLWNDQNYGWWLIGSGTIAFDYTGLWNDPVCGWWLIRDGQIDFGYTGDVNAFDATWHIVNGQLVF